MILTITLNPSMDFIYRINDFNLGANNRTEEPVKMPGGKGINCTRALMNLDANVLAYTILGGENGEIIKNHLLKEKMNFQSMSIIGESRNAYTIMHNNGVQTEIVENGPLVSEQESTEVIDEILDIIRNNKDIDIITINGSINNKDGEYYVRLLKSLREDISRDLTIIMDLSKDSLNNIVRKSNHNPDFIKPNEIEFAELIGKTSVTRAEIINELKKDTINIPYILVSLGGNGAIAKFNDKLFDVTIPKIKLVNPTGSGDSTVAGAAYAFDNNYNDEVILRYSMACGVANAMEEGVGVISETNVISLLNQIEVKEILE